MRFLFLTTLLSLTFLSSGCAYLRQLEQLNAESGDEPAALNASNSDIGAEDEAQFQQRAVRTAVSVQDVVLGMERGDVQDAWGSPAAVEHAGNPAMGNERWIYYEGLSRAPGTASARIIYFENGRVAGWETASR